MKKIKRLPTEFSCSIRPSIYSSRSISESGHIYLGQQIVTKYKDNRNIKRQKIKVTKINMNNIYELIY